MVRQLFKILIVMIGCFAPLSYAATAPQKIGLTIEGEVGVPKAIGHEGSIRLINFEGETTFMIYSITGQLMRNVKITGNNETNVDLPQGYYVVKCHAWSHKIVVR